MNYHHQTIELVLDKESDLYKRIEAAASREGKSIERIVDLIASAGIAYFMSDNLKYRYESEYAQKNL